MNGTALLFALFTLLGAAAYAQDSEDDPPPSARERGGFGCDAGATVASLPSDDQSQHFKAIQEAALEVNAYFCNEMNNALTAETSPADMLIDYGRLLREFQYDFGPNQLAADVQSSMEELTAVFGELDSGTGKRFRMPDFDVAEVLMGGRDDRCLDQESGCFAFNASLLNAKLFAVLDEDELRTCTDHFPGSGGEDPEFELRRCFNVFQDLELAVNSYKRGYQAIYARNAEKTFEQISTEWNRFFDESRSMTFIDLLLTSYFERKHMRVGFIEGPPERQWFALHPNVTLQYVDGAPKGDQFKPGLSIEWFGVNYWDESPLGFPIGVSATTVYADAPDIKTIGHGVTLHVGNRYTVGWARHGSDNSFHVSADILTLFQEKEQQFRKYKDRVERLP